MVHCGVTHIDHPHPQRFFTRLGAASLKRIETNWTLRISSIGITEDNLSRISITLFIKKMTQCLSNDIMCPLIIHADWHYALSTLVKVVNCCIDLCFQSINMLLCV